MDGGNALPIGTRLGEFEIADVIGEGGFGIVYLAHDLSLDRRVAIKEYMPASLAARVRDVCVSIKSERHHDTFEAGRRSFVNEAKLLARYDHPALVKVYRFWEANGTAYMVMPYYDGTTLKEALRRRDPPDEHWLRMLIQQLLEALALLHAERCYHRDIAPDNILLLSNDRPVLLDFGAARRVIGDMTQALTVILKPGFAPVEQYAEIPGVQQGPWTDLYALAAVVYYAIVGKAPAPSVARLMNDAVQPLADSVGGRYSENFLRAIDRALSVRPEHRPQSVVEMMSDLGLLRPELPSVDTRTVMRAAMRTNAPSYDATGLRTTEAAAPSSTTSRAAQASLTSSSVSGVSGASPARADASAPNASSEVNPHASENTQRWIPSIGPMYATDPDDPARRAGNPQLTSAQDVARQWRYRGLAAAAAFVIAGTVGLAWWTADRSTAPQDAPAPPPPTPASGAERSEQAPAAGVATGAPSRLTDDAPTTASVPSTPAGQTAPPASLPAPPPEQRREPPIVRPVQVTAGDVLNAILDGGTAEQSVIADPERSTFRINRDRLRFRVRSSTEGYLYVFMVGAEAKTVTQLFPNAYDRDNWVAANTEVVLPRRGPPLIAQGPPGLDQFVVMVSAQRREFEPAGLRAGNPFATFDIAAARQAAQADGMQALAGKALCEAILTSDCGKYAAARFVVTELE